jgi:hypothetical protein
MAGSLSIEEVIALLEVDPSHPRISTFIETGTLHGESVALMRGIFPICHTIELNESFYKHASTFFAASDITFHHGDSTTVLRTLLPTIKEPAFFFLDAHFSSGETARGSLDCPLLEELSLIEKRSYRDIIVIDDLRLFGTNGAEDWSAISKEAILNRLPAVRSLESNDRFILWR